MALRNTRALSWWLLFIAGLFEVGFTTCLGKAHNADGRSVIWWMAGFLACLSISMVLLYFASRSLPLGTAYAVWTGIGAVGTVIIGIVVFDEPTDLWRMFFLFTLIASLVGLKAVTS